MVAVDSEIGTSAARLWIAAGAAALLAAGGLWAFTRPRVNDARTVIRSGLIVVGAMLGTALMWSFFDRGAARDHDSERRALEMRAEQLSAHALASGSPLACLDGLAGESVEAACEKALFASPESVAAAVSYAAARMTLLADVVDYTKHGGSDIDGVLLPLRRSLETDRFGFIAHALAARDGCTSQNCKALALLRDPSRVRANLSAATLDRYIDHYVTAWAQPGETPVAANDTHAEPGAAGQPGQPGQRKVVVNIDFPTAASIPPVSIMNPEPATKPPPAGANANGAAAGKRGRKQGVGQPADLPPQEPVYLPGAAATAPPASPAPETTATAAPTQSAAPAASAASAPSAPVQLNPFAPQH